MNVENVLVLNAGSSSEKIALYRSGQFFLTAPQAPVWSRNLEVKEDASLDERTRGLEAALSELFGGNNAVLKDASQIQCVGHRVVHGGSQFEKPTLITDATIESIKRYEQFAPLQNPFNLLGIQSLQKLLPGAAQVAVFDTAFHATLPEVAKTYPIPKQWSEQYGIMRYGFHGISHYYLSQRAAAMLGNEQLRIITCHLGNGASLAAVRNGISVDTTMGLTTLEGLMMGTRCGSIDPGIILLLSKQGALSSSEIEDGLYHRSGLKAISGISNDVREIEAAATSGNQSAILAMDMFVDRLVKQIAMMAATLGGVDAIVFSGGIGENSKTIRARTAEGLKFLGVHLDVERNKNVKEDAVISTVDSAVLLLMLRTREEWAIACDCSRLVGGLTS